MRIEPWAWQPQPKENLKECVVCKVCREEGITDVEPWEHDTDCYRYHPRPTYYPAWLLENE